MTFFTKLEQVAERLRERIIAGEYRPGEKLKQADIAAELGVSITPVREALKVLEMEGYLVGTPHKGLAVPEVAPEVAEEIFELRLLLERQLTSRAVDRINDQQLAELRAMHREFAALIKARDIYGVRAANVRFHFRLYQMAQAPQTLQFVRVLWAKYPFNFHTDQVVRFKQILHEHTEFMHKLEAGDKAGAVSAMVSHIQTGWSRVSQNI